MKKIMFNDRYGLTQAVLEGKKTMTRRLMTMMLHKKNGEEIKPVVPDNMFIKDGIAYFCLGNLAHKVPKENQPAYNVGDEVAVAQCYKDIDYRGIVAYEDASDIQPGMVRPIYARESAGWTNKMFVRADLMEETVRITDIKVERLQDISEEDCIKEGVCNAHFDGWCVHGIGMTIPKGKISPIAQTADGKPYYGDRYRDFKFNSPREAFAALIDRISGKGTWNRNPWVYAYEFELIK